MRRTRSPRRWAIAIAVLAAAILTPATAAAAPATRNPWTNPAYSPHPGDWQPYVLAPTGHTVRPVSVWSARQRGGSIDGDPKAVLGGPAAVTLTSSGTRASSPLLILDFGKEVGGEVAMHVLTTSTPAPQLHACFSESIADMALTPAQNNGEAAYAPGCDTANIWNGYPGTPYTWDSDSHTLPIPGKLPATVTDTQPRGGFRYLTIFLDGPGSVMLNDVSLDFQAAPLQSDPAAYQGWFLSSSNALNKLWYAGAYTVQMDTWLSDTAKSWPYATGEPDHSDAQVPGADPNQEVILDGAKRDRVVWQGDLSVEAPVTYLSTDDIGAVNNSLTSLAGQQLSDGFVPAESLVGPHNFGEETTYGEYVTWFVDNAYQHWLYTGDRAYLAANWSALGKAVAWLESVRAQDPRGLIAFGAVNACGHYGYSDCGHETYVNTLYVQNLHQMAQLASALGDSADATTYAARANTVREAINAQLWDPSAGAYRLSREIPDTYPQDANAAAVQTGVASPAQSTSALAYLRANNWSQYGSLTVSTPDAAMSPSYEPLPSGFEAEDRLADDNPLNQLQGEALLNAYWGHELSQDPDSTYWEVMTTAGQPAIGQFTSLAHGWAAAPTVALTNDTLGVTPTSGGYATFDVTPHPGDLAWAQGVVPTPHGAIDASWQANSGGFTLRATVPRSTSARLAVPTSDARSIVRLDGRVVWDGRHAVGGAHASSANGYVRVDDVGPGAHTVQAQHVSAIPTQLSLNAGANASGGTVTIQADLGAVAQGQLDVAVSAQAPAGWQVATQYVHLSTPGEESTTLRVAIPADAKPGTYQLVVTASGGGAQVTNTVPITVTPTGANGTARPLTGWSAASSVSRIEAGFAALGTTCSPWGGNFQLDDVTWS